ncbi:pirin family protein, partial [Caldivirga sp.]|uniref:pirin family protein n=1 Tax=Caldivirga sp. TaxID=2080243 RepID=UPI003D0E8271
VTYLLKGEVHHRDSTGVEGVIRSGDVQWMTAGSGIFHEEMPRPARMRISNSEIEDPEVSGFQLWVNLPSNHKMTVPKYRNLLRSHVPMVDLGSAEVTIIAGTIKAPGYGVVEGPINDLIIPVVYLDVQVLEDGGFTYEVKDGFTTLAYVVSGSAVFDSRGREASAGDLVVFSREGGRVMVKSSGKPARFLLLLGKPIEEPIAWYGPIVMNRWDEISKAFEELRNGEFIKHGAVVKDY